jgi:hypothetical protein
MRLVYKISVLWNLTPCSFIDAYQVWLEEPGDSIVHILLLHLRWRQDIPFKSWYISTNLHGVRHQRTIIILSTVRTGLIWPLGLRGGLPRCMF